MNTLQSEMERWLRSIRRPNAEGDREQGVSQSSHAEAQATQRLTFPQKVAEEMAKRAKQRT